MLSDSFCYYTTNDIKKLIDQEDKENNNPISSLILIAIRMDIESTKFLEDEALNIEFVADGTMRKSKFSINDVVIKKADGIICDRCPGLDWRDRIKDKIALFANKNNEYKEKDPRKLLVNLGKRSGA